MHERGKYGTIMRMIIDELKIVPQYDRKTVCCFTGNRPHKLPWGENESAPKCRAMKKKLRAAIRALAAEGYRLFVSGMAQGGDTLFAEAVLDLRKECGIALECALPYKDQAAGWSMKAQERYRSIAERSDYVTYVSYEYTTACLFRRNRYMVDKSSAIITLDYSEGGGTVSTARYAEKSGLKVIRLGGK